MIYKIPLLKGYRNIAILIIFLAILFIRIYKVPQLFYFGIDEEYQSLLGWSIVKDFHLIWIGLSAGSTGFYVGPGLVYLHSLLLYISRGDPVVLAYSASFIGLLTTATLYFCVNNLFNNKIAIIATTLYGFSAFMNYYDRRFWNPTFVPLISLLMFYSFVKVQKNPWWWVVIAFLLGTSFHIHASLLIFILITIIFLFKYIKSKKLISLKVSLISIVTFFAIYSPLIVYDLAKNFDNLKTPIRMLRSGVGEAGFGFIFKHTSLLFETLSRSILNGSKPFQFAITVALLLGFLYSQRKNSQKKFQEPISILALIFSIYIFSFIFFPGEILDYYAIGIIPLFFISISFVFNKFPNLFLVSIIFIFLISNLPSILKNGTKSGLMAKKEFIQKVSKSMKNERFYLDTSGPYLYNGGWRYLFKIYGKTPVASRADDMFGWIYPDEKSTIYPSKKVIISENQILTKDTKLIKTIRSGIFTATIYENK